jgi:endonuclease III
MLKILLHRFGKLYSEELGINLKTKKSTENFKWFLAAILLGARISETIAKNTYRALKKYKLLTPKAIIKTTWKFLVSHVMAEGGYVRYDEKTSAMLLDICKKLIAQYNGDLNQLYLAATDANDLVQKLLDFKGIGPITVNIFLRELRGIWKKADPPFSDFVKLGAKSLGIKDLKQYWQKNKITGYRFAHFEVALLRLGKDFCHKNKCKTCPLKSNCKRKNL